MLHRDSRGIRDRVSDIADEWAGMVLAASRRRTGMPVIHGYEETSYELGTGQGKLESGQGQGEAAVGQTH
jgi:hypothetical protein